MIDKTPPISPRKPIVPPSSAAKSERKTPIDKPDAPFVDSNPVKSSEVSPSRNKEVKTPGEVDVDGGSIVSERTKLSVTALSFTKDSKIVRTISFDEDEVVVDTASPEKPKGDEDASGKSTVLSG